MAKAKFKIKGVPPRQPGEEPATQIQLDYLRSLADFKEADLGRLGKAQAACIIDQAKDARNAYQQQNQSIGNTIIIGFIVLFVIAAAVGWWRLDDIRAALQPVVKSAQTSENTSAKPEPAARQTTEQATTPGTRPQTKPAPAAKTSPAAKSFATFEDVTLPITLKTTDTVNLLDAAGKELPIPTGTRLTVEKRSPTGTLTIHISGKTYVGNETRLARKVAVP